MAHFHRKFVWFGVGIAAASCALATASPSPTKANSTPRLQGAPSRFVPALVRRPNTRPRSAATPTSCGTNPPGQSFIGIPSGQSDSAAGVDSGELAGFANAACAQFSGIGGGAFNTVTGNGSFIAGGNFIEDENSAPGSTISGQDSFVGAGDDNQIQNNDSFVGAGEYNIIYQAGQYDSIASGFGDVIDGNADFIGAGTQDKITASAADSAIASGALNYVSGSGSFIGAGVKLAAGSGAWANLSDRNSKTDIVPLDDASILSRVDTLPVSTWRYKTESGVRHAGPMAQDFYAAFRVGEDDRHITSIDEDGVALAAIKALHAENRGLHRDNASLRRDNGTLHSEVERLASTLRALSATVGRLERPHLADSAYCRSANP